MSHDRVALVTGATSGIGAATAQTFAKAGYRVVLAGRRADKGEAVAATINDAGGEATFVQTDVADVDQIKRLIDTTESTYGRLDAAFNNAGIEGDLFVPLHTSTVDNYQRVFDINVRGVMVSMQHQIPLMLKTGGGSIINNSSIAGVVGFQGMSIYTASKHAVIGFTKGAALEYAKSGIRVNAVGPGAIETEMYGRFAADKATQDMMASLHPVGRAGKPEEIASAVLWLADPANSFTTGQAINVDGGFTAQ
ncbi:MAG: SDR family oxidoreductase [Planctomycetota bacterium]|jgi:NAD(P)-dependent dehydrogenase (short-subunit alcohol dehydrogenase family)|nr:SDR family oxidoreductase [Planctomycetota bacterium]